MLSKISEEDLYTSQYKIGREFFNFPIHQLKTNENLSQYYIRTTPDGTYSNTLTQNGGNINFTLEDRDNYIYKSFIYSFKLSNADAVNANTLIAGPMMLSSVDVLQQGNGIHQYKDYMIWMKNSIDLDKNDYEKSMLTSSGILLTDITKGVTLATSSNQTFFIEIPCVISDLYFYKSKVKPELKLRFVHKAGVSVTDDTDITISDIALYINAIEIPSNLSNTLLNQPLINYRLNLPQTETYSLNNGITSGVEQEIRLTSYNYQASLLILFVKKANDTLVNNLKFYGVSNLELLNSSNKSITNDIYFDTEFMRYSLNKYLFKGSSFFQNKVYMLSFCDDPRGNILENTNSGSVSLNDAKLKIKFSESDANPCELIVTFFNPSMLKIDGYKGKIELTRY